MTRVCELFGSGYLNNRYYDPATGAFISVSRPGFDAVLIPWSKGCGEGDCCHGTSVEVHARVPPSSD